ncbi:SMI1/KNR4 family protein [Nocardia yamanashiensis]|uniref:SMI1/KNR4 family protein n=1 Tax=Nocardia yamanashiensis TaxID=209247 RepID=UPI001E4ABD49|nr:SMI1/KNR4 family protein [Nocardia yamanashiensis]UGT42866.1 SMI1/KNR4 family protein [Nocardia yamanashiensis]
MDAVTLFGEYVDWLRANVPLAFENLAPPATSTEIADLEHALGQHLPDDVKAVLQLHNGQRATDIATGGDGAVPCIPTLSFLSTHLILECWSAWVDIREDPNIEQLQSMGEVMPGAEGRVKPLYSSPGWIPLWSDPARSDYIGLDLDPDTGGIPGQIINFGRDEERHFVCADSFTDLLGFLLEEVRSGRWPASTLVEGEDDDEDYDDAGGYQPEAYPWFGPPGEHFFNALYTRAMHSAR